MRWLHFLMHSSLVNWQWNWKVPLDGTFHNVHEKCQMNGNAASLAPCPRLNCVPWKTELCCRQALLFNFAFAKSLLQVIQLCTCENNLWNWTFAWKLLSSLNSLWHGLFQSQSMPKQLLRCFWSHWPCCEWLHCHCLASTSRLCQKAEEILVHFIALPTTIGVSMAVTKNTTNLSDCQQSTDIFKIFQTTLHSCFEIVSDFWLCHGHWWLSSSCFGNCGTGQQCCLNHLKQDFLNPKRLFQKCANCDSQFFIFCLKIHSNFSFHSVSINQRLIQSCSKLPQNGWMLVPVFWKAKKIW